MSFKLITTIVTDSEEAAKALRDKISEIVVEAEQRIHDIAHTIHEALPGVQAQADEAIDEAKAAADKAAQEAADVAANVENRTSGVADHDVTSPGGVEGLSGPQPPVSVEGNVSFNAPVSEGTLQAEGHVSG